MKKILFLFLILFSNFIFVFADNCEDDMVKCLDEDPQLAMQTNPELAMQTNLAKAMQADAAKCMKTDAILVMQNYPLEGIQANPTQGMMYIKLDDPSLMTDPAILDEAFNYNSGIDAADILNENPTLLLDENVLTKYDEVIQSDISLLNGRSDALVTFFKEKGMITVDDTKLGEIVEIASYDGEIIQTLGARATKFKITDFPEAILKSDGSLLLATGEKISNGEIEKFINKDGTEFVRIKSSIVNQGDIPASFEFENNGYFSADGSDMVIERKSQTIIISGDDVVEYDLLSNTVKFTFSGTVEKNTKTDEYTFKAGTSVTFYANSNEVYSIKVDNQDLLYANKCEDSYLSSVSCVEADKIESSAKKLNTEDYSKYESKYRIVLGSLDQKISELKKEYEGLGDELLEKDARYIYLQSERTRILAFTKYEEDNYVEAFQSGATDLQSYYYTGVIPESFSNAPDKLGDTAYYTGMSYYKAQNVGWSLFFNTDPIPVTSLIYAATPNEVHTAYVENIDNIFNPLSWFESDETTQQESELNAFTESELYQSATGAQRKTLVDNFYRERGWVS